MPKIRMIVASVGDFAPFRDVRKCKSGVNKIWEYLRQADLSIANLEIPLTNALGRADKAATIKADPSLASSIAEVGIDVLTIANNHALDYGAEGMMEARFLPIKLNFQGDPVFLDEPSSVTVLDRLNRLSKPFNVLAAIDGSVGRLKL
ncbi:CapA family protein [Ammoniphilus sp. YIM 78166]|uniref:CapA family protein n=1 Tax=Ammoniphilus sp. YIM 78166 TaxID=1644106 RepID=UPI001431E955|nr:CapA family protein [Ammoniphilus sp. YIM 78166]